MKTLLLNYNYQVINFISERKAIKILLAGKAEIIANWNGMKISYGSGYVNHPATIRMLYLIKLNPTKLSFSRSLVLRRDKYQCAYCGDKATPLTIDHILPKSLGGINSFYNCVAACNSCNKKKANKRLEESGLSLRINPKPPAQFIFPYPPINQWHEDWTYYL